MNYSTIIPDPPLKDVVECYWTVTGNETEEQKIVPDGFPEIIFHFGDVYELADGDGAFIQQARMIMSGQISRPIVLRPRGRSDVFGIKFRPTGIWKLFGVHMSDVKDCVVALDKRAPIASIYDSLQVASDEQRIKIAGDFLCKYLKSSVSTDDASVVVKSIELKRGNVSMGELCDMHNISARTLQRIFQRQVGVTAKQYSRLVRFRTAYAMLQKPLLTKGDALFLTGYFDQPHFNKEFREFTHENPETWFANNHAFSNLFMNR
ncbi:MAG TPA: helix-turn-helix domain-containing protein [Chryseosolibacter sp.]